MSAKKGFILISTGILALSMSACGGVSGTAGQGNTSTSNSTSQNTVSKISTKSPKDTVESLLRSLAEGRPSDIKKLVMPNELDSLNIQSDSEASKATNRIKKWEVINTSSNDDGSSSVEFEWVFKGETVRKTVDVELGGSDGDQYLITDISSDLGGLTFAKGTTVQFSGGKTLTKPINVAVPGTYQVKLDYFGWAKGTTTIDLKDETIQIAPSALTDEQMKDITFDDSAFRSALDKNVTPVLNTSGSIEGYDTTYDVSQQITINEVDTRHQSFTLNGSIEYDDSYGRPMSFTFPGGCSYIYSPSADAYNKLSPSGNNPDGCPSYSSDLTPGEPPTID